MCTAEMPTGHSPVTSRFSSHGGRLIPHCQLRIRSTDELGSRRSDLLWKTRKLTLSARTHVEVPATASIRHAAPVLRNR
jgi:hypothetical protein